jgi:hypothetical protein
MRKTISIRDDISDSWSAWALNLPLVPPKAITDLEEALSARDFRPIESKPAHGLSPSGG